MSTILTPEPECPVCGGRGELNLNHYTSDPQLEQTIPCPGCDATGHVDQRDVRRLTTNRRWIKQDALAHEKGRDAPYWHIS